MFTCPCRQLLHFFSIQLNQNSHLPSINLMFCTRTRRTFILSCSTFGRNNMQRTALNTSTQSRRYYWSHWAADLDLYLWDFRYWFFFLWLLKKKKKKKETHTSKSFFFICFGVCWGNCEAAHGVVNSTKELFFFSMHLCRCNVPVLYLKLCFCPILHEILRQLLYLKIIRLC